MVRGIVGSSLKFPLLVAGLVLGVFAAGFAQLREMPVDALPDFSPVYVEVQTPGHEVEHPMAIVILGGLVTSTLLNLFAVPFLYLRFGGERPAGAPVAQPA